MRERIISNIIYSVLITSLLMVCFSSCKYDEGREVNIASQELQKEKINEIIVGAERIGLYFNSLKDKKVACVVNHTSMVGSKHLVDTLLRLKIDITKVFAPEHGFRGDVPDGEKIEDDIDPESGVPIVSLYGKKRKPTPEDLVGIDVILFDIQDVGARFYTYLSTLHNIMESCAEQNIKCIVLDRPNPNGHYIDGPILEPDQITFVGMHPVPIVYGMTIGEYAKMINGEGWLSNGVKCNLEIIQLKNYTHDTFYEVPIPPSPNLPNQRAILLYPSLCLFEGTHMSIGRGTEKQFQLLGHPQLVDHGFKFTPKPNKGSKYPKHDGTLCYGQDLSSMSIDSIRDMKRINISWLLAYHRLLKNIEEDFFIENRHFDRIAGTKRLKKQLIEDYSEEEIRGEWKSGLDKFKSIRSKYLLYP